MAIAHSPLCQVSALQIHPFSLSSAENFANDHHQQGEEKDEDQKKE